jgi:hypothetical protein
MSINENNCRNENKIVVNGQHLVSRDKLKQTDMFGSLLSCYSGSNIRELQLPLPSSSSSSSQLPSLLNQTVTNDYIQYLQYEPKSVHILCECLKYAHLVGDKNYLLHLINEMLASWKKLDYSVVMDSSSLNFDLKRDIYCYFPFHMVPKEYHNNNINSPFYKEWSRTHKRSAIVDGRLYTHDYTSESSMHENHATINCYCNGSLLSTHGLR